MWDLLSYIFKKSGRRPENILVDDTPRILFLLNETTEWPGVEENDLEDTRYRNIEEVRRRVLNGGGGTQGGARRDYRDPDLLFEELTLEEEEEYLEFINDLQVLCFNLQERIKTLGQQQQQPRHCLRTKTCCCEDCLMFLEETHFLMARRVTNWDEGKIHKIPSFLVGLNPILFYLEMGFRLLRNAPEILLTESGKMPPGVDFWMDTNATFRGKGFPVPDTLQPLGLWDMDTLQQAFRILVDSRKEIMLEVVTQENIEVFHRYKERLLDRLSIFCFLNVNSQNFEVLEKNSGVTEVSLWFKEYEPQEEQKWSEVTEEFLGGGNEMNNSLLKKYEETFMLAGGQQGGGGAIDEEEDTGTCPTGQSIQVLKEVREHTRREIKRSIKQMEEEGEDVSHLVAATIEQKNSLIQQIVDARFKDYDEEREKQRWEDYSTKRLARIKERGEVVEEEAKKMKVLDHQNVTMSFLTNFYLLADEVQLFKFSSAPRLLLSNNRHVEMAKLFCKEFLVNIFVGEELVMWKKCKEWILLHNLSFQEREKYRRDIGSKPNSKADDVCVYTRGNLGLVQFPDKIHSCFLKDNNPVWYDWCLAFACYYWLQQNCQAESLDVDESIFLWNYEDVYCQVDRPNLRRPTITHVGGEWLIITPEQGWSDPETYKPRALWVGGNFLTCFVHWVDLMHPWGFKVLERGRQGGVEMSLLKLFRTRVLDKNSLTDDKSFFDWEALEEEEEEEKG